MSRKAFASLVLLGCLATAADGGPNVEATTSWSSPTRRTRATMASSNSPDAPKFSVAGTVYPTSHEPDDCNGVKGSSGITIVITDATGKQIASIPVNDVGNFHYEGNVGGPFHVKVVAQGKENAMSASPANGECNSCHTRAGANNAPGRILAP